MSAAELTVEQTLARVAGHVWGVDLSHWQGEAGLDDPADDEVELDELAQAGCRFVLVKATEGRGSTDRQWKRTAGTLVARGVEGPASSSGLAAVGSWHYARIDSGWQAPEADARAEAEDHVRAIEAVPGWLDLPGRPWLDAEWFGSLAPAEVRDAVERNQAWVLSWLSRVDELLGAPGIAGVYTGPNVWAGRFGRLDVGDRRLWVARYIRPPGQAEPLLVGPAGHRREWTPTVHQWTGSGRVPGIDRRVDVNVLHPGAELRELVARPAVVYPATSAGLVGWVEIAARMAEATLARFDLPPDLDLRPGVSGPAVALLQGVLLGRGRGPSGLVGPDGRPDGKLGPATLAAARAELDALGLRGVDSISLRVWLALLSAPSV